jgi:hypothetical protein
MMNENTIKLVDELFKRSNKRNCEKLYHRIGYVCFMFIRDNEFVSETRIPRSAKDDFGWTNPNNWGKGNGTENDRWGQLFDELCPVEVESRITKIKNGVPFSDAPIRSLNFELLDLLIETSQNYLKKTDIEWGEFVEGAIDHWRDNELNELVEKHKAQAQSQWVMEKGSRADPASSRVYHPLQNVRTEMRGQVLGRLGYRVSADVRSCHPVLLCQWWQRWSGELPGLSELVRDPEDYRSRVAAAVAAAGGVEIADVLPSVKRALSALLHDRSALPHFSSVGTYTRQVELPRSRDVVSVWCGVSDTYDSAFNMYNTFRHNTLVRQLARDYQFIRKMLGIKLNIRSEDELKEIANKTGIEFDELELVRKSQNPLYYLCELLEKKVIDVITNKFSHTNPFRIHDCVVLKEPPREELSRELSALVEKETDYKIKFAITKLN